MRQAIRFTVLTIPALILGCTNSVWAQENFERLTTVELGQTPLFQVIAGSGGYSAVERTKQMQERLNLVVSDALSCNRMPEISIRQSGSDFMLLVDNKVIGDADKGTAAGLNISQKELARQWAGQLKTALVKDSTIHFASIPAGLILPVCLSMPIRADDLKLGKRLEAKTTEDVGLPDGTKLSSGAGLSGEISTIKTNGIKTIIVITFDRMTLNSGAAFPIAARSQPVTAETLTAEGPLNVRIMMRAQIAATGSSI